MLKKLLICAFTIGLTSGTGMAMDHSGHAMATDAAGRHEMATPESGHEGTLVHTSQVNGYTLQYYLIDMKKKMSDLIAASQGKMSADMLHSMKSHHLMLFVLGQNGEKVADGRVGFLLTSKDATLQKAMTMAMDGGYGADVDLEKANGPYTVETKAVLNGKKLMDSFPLTP